MKRSVPPTPRHAGGAVMGEGEPSRAELLGCCSPKERCFPQFCPGLKKKKENGNFLCDGSTRLSSSGGAFLKLIYLYCVALMLPCYPCFYILFVPNTPVPTQGLIILHNSLLGVFCIYFCPEISSSSEFRNTIKSSSMVRHFRTSRGHCVSTEPHPSGNGNENN